MLGVEAGVARDLLGRRAHGLLEPRGCGHVLDRAARRADEMVMVLGEVLGELVARDVVPDHETVHQARLLEHHQVAVHGARGQARPEIQDLGDREWTGGCGEDLHECFAIRGDPLLGPPETGRDGVA